VVENLRNWWTNYSREKRNRQLLYIIGFIWLVTLIIVSSRIPGWCTIGVILLCVSLYHHEREWSFYSFAAAVFFLLFSTPLTMLGLLLIGLYLFYKLLDKWRIKRIQKIANMNPTELSRVKYSKPEVEIIIKRGR
jgi:predicted membrane protein